MELRGLSRKSIRELSHSVKYKCKETRWRIASEDRAGQWLENYRRSSWYWWFLRFSRRWWGFPGTDGSWYFLEGYTLTAAHAWNMDGAVDKQWVQSTERYLYPHTFSVASRNGWAGEDRREHSLFSGGTSAYQDFIKASEYSVFAKQHPLLMTPCYCSLCMWALFCCLVWLKPSFAVWFSESKSENPYWSSILDMQRIILCPSISYKADLKQPTHTFLHILLTLGCLPTVVSRTGLNRGWNKYINK